MPQSAVRSTPPELAHRLTKSNLMAKQLLFPVIDLHQ